ncbi:hypothetical protein AVEN_265200-1 [Araneus ventricosus]|uniref:Uncharacterized protein n=1 Tax=Araneus ventricosus TaxID=182803 RepID=A0A4Y2CQI8_ARAVE|nr:hypothetical protein AVEN_265200-1 [Araneus ventricosus]
MQQPLVSAVVRIRPKIPPTVEVVNLCIYAYNHLPLQSGQPKPSALTGGLKLWNYSTLCPCRVVNLCLTNHPPLRFDHLMHNISTFPPLRNDHSVLRTFPRK